MNKTLIFQDGPTLEEIKKFFDKVDGYTFNPSLFKKLGAKDYLGFTKQILNYTKEKSVSIEVFADNQDDCYEQAMKIKSVDPNIVVKIPISYTNGKSTVSLISKLVKDDVKLNITAIFTIDQIKQVLPEIKSTKTILSIFSGRLFDIGVDAFKAFSEMSNHVRSCSDCKTLWASCRMAYDFKLAEKAGADIITMPTDLIAKLGKFGYDPTKYSIDTVKAFFDDAKKSDFKI